MPIELTYRKIGDETTKPPLVILHGLLGSAGNWRSIARQMAGGRSVYCLNLRNHGDSPHAPTMTYQDMAGDVAAFIQKLELASSPDLLGHSMGGKVAMMLALDSPGVLRRLIVVDTAPVAYQFLNFDMFEAIKGVDLSRVTRREDADQQMRIVLKNDMLRSFVLTNLRRGSDGFFWRVNVDAIAAHLGEIIGFPDQQGVTFGRPALFLGGARSDYLSGHDAEIYTHFPQAEVQLVEGAGHWPHADKPAETVHALKVFLEPAEVGR